MGNKELQGVQGVTTGYGVLKRATTGYKGLQGVKKG